MVILLKEPVNSAWTNVACGKTILWLGWNLDLLVLLLSIFRRLPCPAAIVPFTPCPLKNWKLPFFVQNCSKPLFLKNPWYPCPFEILAEALAGRSTREQLFHTVASILAYQGLSKSSFPYTCYRPWQNENWRLIPVISANQILHFWFT
jgi:hypothetical protein